MNASNTLAERMATGCLAEQDGALRIVILLAQTIREAHENGHIHGAISPATVAIDGDDVRLAPASETSGATPYTAPEILQGMPADARSDIFSFGAIVYEMLTGRRAFEGATPEALAEALMSATPRTCGNPVADRLLNGCLAKSPEARFQRMQNLMVDLRVLASSARRRTPAPAETVIAAPTPDAVAQPVADRHMAYLGVRLAARKLGQDNSVVRLGRIADQALRRLQQKHAAAALPNEAMEPHSIAS